MPYGDIISDKMDILQYIFLPLKFRFFNPIGFIFEPLEK